MTGLHDWFQTPPGEYLLAWERARFDAALADVFGYHALQIGLPAIDALAANRMPHRWLALTGPPSDPPAAAAAPPARPRAMLVADGAALPFAEASLDLVALPHTLELSRDPHATLREVQRVLVPEGRVAIAGFNPASLWGLRQRGCSRGDRRFVPGAGPFIGHWRLRDWLRLLALEPQALSFGCYRPPLRGARALARFGWLDRAGARGWPIFGAAYFMVAVKRTRGAAWKTPPAVVCAPAPVAGGARRHEQPR